LVPPHGHHTLRDFSPHLTPKSSACCLLVIQSVFALMVVEAKVTVSVHSFFLSVYILNSGNIKDMLMFSPKFNQILFSFWSRQHDLHRVSYRFVFIVSLSGSPPLPPCTLNGYGLPPHHCLSKSNLSDIQLETGTCPQPLRIFDVFGAFTNL